MQISVPPTTNPPRIQKPAGNIEHADAGLVKPPIQTYTISGWLCEGHNCKSLVKGCPISEYLDEWMAFKTTDHVLISRFDCICTLRYPRAAVTSGAFGDCWVDLTGFMYARVKRRLTYAHVKRRLILTL